LGLKQSAFGRQFPTQSLKTPNETEQKQLEVEVITLQQEIKVQERQNKNIKELDPYALKELSRQSM